MTKIITRVAVTVAAVARLLLAPEAAVAQCCGDCNGDGQVTIDELLKSVDRALSGCHDDGICSQSGGQRLPATGQTTCWDADGIVIACNGTGQDGELQAGGALAYVDNGDGTISDLNTHLMWEKKSDDGGIHDWDTVHTWAEAFSTFIAGLNADGGFAGHTDWRLPNVRELQSIVDYQNAPPAVSAAFNTDCAPNCTVTTCSCTQPDNYWSSTTSASPPTSAWSVYFTGGVFNFPKTSEYRVRAVRGGL
jgi:hypothetical protein